MPLAGGRARHFWERWHPAVALLLAALVASFMALIGSLYVVAGGIHLELNIAATPASKTAFLSVGGVLANLIGTTGASMVLIRPWLVVGRWARTGKIRATRIKAETLKRYSFEKGFSDCPLP